MIIIGVLIYQSRVYGEAVKASLFKHTPHLRDGRAQLLFIGNDPTREVMKWLEHCGVLHDIQLNPKRSEAELFAMGFGKPEYIHRVYRGWNAAVNKAIAHGADQIVLVNSDMMFSPGWLEALLEADDGTTLPVSQLVEPGHPQHEVFPGALKANFGRHPKVFREEEWLTYAADLLASGRSGLAEGGPYQPCLLRREWVERWGVFPEGNLAGGSFDEVKAYGDEAYFARLAEAGIRHRTVKHSLVYHIKEGEQDEPVFEQGNGEPEGGWPHAFLHEPDWSGSEWVEVLLSYWMAFPAEANVGLVFSWNPAAEGQLSMAEAENLVLELARQSGRERFADTVLVDSSAELHQTLKRYQVMQWIPSGRGAVQGLHGEAGLRFAQARLALTAEPAAPPPPQPPLSDEDEVERYYVQYLPQGMLGTSWVAHYLIYGRFLKEALPVPTLDLCCGAGAGTAMLAEALKVPILGIDRSDEALHYASEVNNRPRITYHKVDLDDPSDRAQLSALVSRAGIEQVFFIEGIEHLADPEGVLDLLLAANVRRIFISTPVEPAGSQGGTYHTNPFTPERFDRFMQRYRATRLGRCLPLVLPTVADQLADGRDEQWFQDHYLTEAGGSDGNYLIMIDRDA